MNGETLFEALNFVDEGLIAETQQSPPVVRSKRIVRFAAMAACAVLAVTIGWNVWPRRTSPVGTVRECPAPAEEQIVFPDANRHCQQVAPGRIAASIREWDLAALAEQADLVIVTDVIQVTAYENTVRYSHVVDTIVTTVLKGDVRPGDTVCVRDNNFGDTHTTDGGLMLEEGNRVLLFLNEQPPEYSLSGKTEYTYSCENLGKFFYDRDDKFYSSAVYGDDFGHHALWSMSALTEYSPKTLDDIKSLIDGNRA